MFRVSDYILVTEEEESTKTNCFKITRKSLEKKKLEDQITFSIAL